MALNPFFRQEVASEQRLVQDLVNEHLRMYGQDVYYMPRKYMGTDSIMRENILSRFDDAYPIEAYIANVDGFQGSGDLMTKFGIRVTDEATFIISKERFEDYVADIISNIASSQGQRRGDGVVADRPMEGDLIYFPLTDSLFEIKFVEHESPFYQLGSLYTYELRCELFEYENEVIDTDISDIDDNVENIGYVVTVTLAGTGVTATALGALRNGAVNQIILENDGYGYSSVPIVSISTSPAGTNISNATAVAIGTIGAGQTSYSVQSIKITNSGFGYTEAPTVKIIGSGFGAKARANIGTSGVFYIPSFTEGSEYTVTPNVAVSTSPVGIASANATVEAIVSATGTISGFRYTNAGFGYTQSPIVTIDTPFKTRSATGKAGISTSISFYTVTETTTGLGSTVIAGVATTSGTILTSPTDTITGIDTTSLSVGYGLTGIGISEGTYIVGIGSTNAPDVVIVGLAMTVGVGTTTFVFTDVTTPIVSISTTFTRSLLSGIVTSISVTDAGIGYSVAPTVTISNPSEFSAGILTASVGVGSTVTSIFVSSGGVGYGTTPLAVFDTPSGFRVGVITAGVGIGTTLNSITLDNPGAFYATAPTLSISGPAGVGSTAAATALINSSGIITSVTITNPGFGYTNTEPITVTVSGGISTATASVQISAGGTITSASIINPGFGYTTIPNITLVGGISTATAVSFINSVGIVTGTSISNPGFGYTRVPTVTFSNPTTPVNTGNYIYNEMVTGQTGLATALVKTWNGSTRTLELYSVAGDLRVGEILIGSATTVSTGNTSHVTAAYFVENISYEHNDSAGVDAYESNTEFQDAATDVDGIVDWTETNPFGTF